MKRYSVIYWVSEFFLGFIIFISLNAFFPWIYKITFSGFTFELRHYLIPTIGAWGLSLIAFISFIHSFGTKKIKLWKESYLLILFLLWSFICSLLSPSPIMSLLYFLADCILIITILILTSLENKLSLERILIWSVILTLSASIIVSFMEMRGIYFERVKKISELNFPFGNRTDLASLGALSLIFFLRKQNLIGAFISSISSLFIGLSYNIYLFIISLIVLLLSSVFFFLKRNYSSSLISLLFFLLLFVGMKFYLSYSPRDYQSEIILNFQRKLLAKEQFNVILKNPLFGCGRGLFSQEFNFHQSDDLKWALFQTKTPNHSVEPLSLLAKTGGETGIPGALLFLGIILWRTLSKIKSALKAPAFKILPRFIILSTFLWGTGSYRIFINLILFIFLLLAEEEPDKSLSPPSLFPHYFSIFSFLFLSITISSTITWRGVMSRVEMMKAEKLKSGRRAGEIPYIIRAWELSPFDPEITYLFGSSIFQYGGYDRALRRMDAVLKLYYAHSGSLWLKVQCEKFEGLEFFKDLSTYISLNPFDAIAAPEYLKELLKRGKMEEAKNFLQRFLSKRAEGRKFLQTDPELRVLFEKSE